MGVGIVGLGFDDFAEVGDGVGGASHFEKDGAGHGVGVGVVGIDGDDGLGFLQGFVLASGFEAGLDALKSDGIGLALDRLLLGRGRLVRVVRPLRPGSTTAEQECGASDELWLHG